MEGSIESNPTHNSPTAVAYSSHSDSPMMDLSELQADANLAINHMLSIKRSSDLERQQAIWDFKASLHQQEAEEAAANERARIVHSRNDLNAKVKCVKAVMKAKYEYRVAIQEARVNRCSKLEESEAAYSQALSENAWLQSPFNVQHCCSEHTRHMHELERQALDVENKSCQDFLLAHQAILCHALQSLKENLHSSYHILLEGNRHHPFSPFHLPGHPRQRGNHLQLLLSGQNPNGLHCQKGGIPQQMHRGTCP